MSGFFEEVQRRKVYRVAVAYIVVSAGLIQLASAVFPAWELPTWSLRFVVVLLLVGFPIALILAWAFDVTPQGIRSTPRVETHPATAPRSRRNAITLLAVGLAISVIAGAFLLPRASARKIDKSIAVLPFENLSDDKENAFFADGIQDDILTNLAKIGELKVISRTSVMGYRNKPSSVREIGRALGVSAILEGSVRRSGNRVRLNVQLINAANDQHLWAEDYDRDLTDMFAIQTDLAQKVANELRAKLSPSEKAQMSRKPTENGEAYLAFVQAHNLFAMQPEDYEKLKQAEQLYERALQLDPNFALACASLAQLESWIYRNYDKTPARREKGRALAQRALQTQQDLPEAHLALGFSRYYGDLDFDGALREFLIAKQGLPNASEAYLAIGAIQRRQGQWAESTANLEKAASLNPNDSWPLQNLALNYQMTRDYAAANKTVDRALKISPNSFGLWETKAKLAIEEKGDFDVAEQGLKLLDTLAPDSEKQHMLVAARVSVLLLQRKFADALREAEAVSDDSISANPEIMTMKYLAIGTARRELADETGARAAFTKAKALAEAQTNDTPSDPNRRAQLAVALARLGEKEAALTEVKRAMDLLPESKDAFDGPALTELAAEIHTIVGEKSRAIDLLDGLLTRPSTVTVQLLKLNPVWDPLRDDPRFQQLLIKHGAKA